MTALVRKNKLRIIAGFGLLVALVVVLTLSNEQFYDTDAGDCSKSNLYAQKHNVSLDSSGKNKLDIEFATTVSQQQVGLSGRPCIPKNGALIFIFPTDDKFGIWMKDMNFSIDVVWLDKDKKIVSLDKNMQPNSYPKVYYPKSDARYAIELNAGQADKIGLTEGQVLNW